MLTESQHRLFSKLHQDLGDKIISFLADKDINEVMLNPDGSLWVDSVKEAVIPQECLSFLICKIAFSINFSLSSK